MAFRFGRREVREIANTQGIQMGRLQHCGVPPVVDAHEKLPDYSTETDSYRIESLREIGRHVIEHEYGEDTELIGALVLGNMQEISARQNWHLSDSQAGFPGQSWPDQRQA